MITCTLWVPIPREGEIIIFQCQAHLLFSHHSLQRGKTMGSFLSPSLVVSGEGAVSQSVGGWVGLFAIYHPGLERMACDWEYKNWAIARTRVLFPQGQHLMGINRLPGLGAIREHVPFNRGDDKHALCSFSVQPQSIITWNNKIN